MFGADGIAEGAFVHPTAEIEDGVTIDPGAVIGPRAGVGSGTVIGATAVIGPDVQIGRDCSVGPGASVLHALIGDGVILHAGCRIGQDGYRYQPSASGHIKVPQLGRVIIQDHVEIGANSTIDRGGSPGDTVRSARAPRSITSSRSATTARSAGHCLITAHCRSGRQRGARGFRRAWRSVRHRRPRHHRGGCRCRCQESGVMRSIPAGERWFGYPAMPGREYMRIIASPRKRD